MKKTLNNLDTFIELIPDLAFCKNIEGQYTNCNNAFLNFIKKDRKDVIGKTDLELFSNKNALRFKEDDEKIFKDSQTRSYEEIFHQEDGYVEYFQTTKQVIYNEEKKQLGLFCIAKSITIEKQYEFIYEDNKMLLEYIATHNDLTKVLEKIVRLAEKRNSNSKCSILILDESKTKLLSGSAPSLPDFYNEAINGIEIGEKIGSCGSAAFKKQRVIVENIDTHENWQPFLSLTNKANLHACWSEPIFSSKDEILGSFAIYSDRVKSPSEYELKLINSYANLASVAIEKENNTKEAYAKKEQLLQQSKLASMGEMISMIAHQWRQPLSAISATAGSMQVKIAMDKYEKDFFSKQLEEVGNLAQHLSTTIEDFRNFFKPDKSRSVFSIKSAIQSSVKLSESSILKNYIELKTDYSSNSKIKSYRNEVVQVLLNILQNAIDALVEKEITSPRISINVHEDEQGNVLVNIEDNAGGIPQDHADKIFEPYFSTKLTNGTGLGLYMSKMIIEEHCYGELSFSNTSEGACFKIKFTISDINE